jgi:hypothetical protein
MKRQLMALLLLVMQPWAYAEAGRLPPLPEADILDKPFIPSKLKSIR